MNVEHFKRIAKMLTGIAPMKFLNSSKIDGFFGRHIDRHGADHHAATAGKKDIPKPAYFTPDKPQSHTGKIRQPIPKKYSRRTRGGHLIAFISIALGLTQVALATENREAISKHTQKPACPSRNFQDFLSAYANSETIQRTFIKIPIKIQKLDQDAEPEPKPVTKKLKHSQLKFPLLPLADERGIKSLTLRIDTSSEKKAKATLFKQDTGYQVTYFFDRNGCWTLAAIEDWSI